MLARDFLHWTNLQQRVELLKELTFTRQDPIAMNELGDFYMYHEGADPKQAFAWYQKSANKGNTEGRNELARCYYLGSGVSTNYEKAVEIWRGCAVDGSSYAMRFLAYCYEDGTGVAKDIVEAAKWALKAAELGDLKSMLNIAKDFAMGLGVKKDKAKARFWFDKAIEEGAVGAEDMRILFLGRFGWLTHIVSWSFLLVLVAAVIFVKPGKRDGVPVEIGRFSAQIGRFHGAPVTLGFSVLLWFVFDACELLSGDIAFVDYLVFTLGLGLSLIGHEFGHAFVGHLLGWKVKMITIQAFGGLTYFDDEGERRWLMVLAGPAVNLLLALILWFADCRGMSYLNLVLGLINLIPAYPMDGGQVLQIALSRFFSYSKVFKIIYFVGTCASLYFFADGVRRIFLDCSGWGFVDVFLAGVVFISVRNQTVSLERYYVSLMKKAREGNLDARHELGVAYLRGTDIPKNKKKGLALLNKNYRMQHLPSILYLAMFYSDEGTKSGYRKAIKYRKTAVSLGDVASKWCIGIMYEDGLGVRKNLDKAEQMYRDAIADGETYAEYLLGDLLTDQEDRIEDGIRYVRSAASKGDEDALDWLAQNEQFVKAYESADKHD